MKAVVHNPGPGARVSAQRHERARACRVNPVDVDTRRFHVHPFYLSCVSVVSVLHVFHQFHRLHSE